MSPTWYPQLDRLFPGLREHYERACCDHASARAPAATRPESLFSEPTARCGLVRRVTPYHPPQAEQLTLFPGVW